MKSDVLQDNMFDITFRINGSFKHDVKKNKEFDKGNILVKFPIPWNIKDEDLHHDLLEVIWRIKELYRPNLSNKKSNAEVLEEDTVGVIMAKSHNFTFLYLDLDGKIHIPTKKNEDIAEKKTVIELDNFGKWVHVPSVKGIKITLNILSMLNDKRTYEHMSNNALAKLSHLKEDDTITIASVVECLPSIAGDILHKRTGK